MSLHDLCQWIQNTPSSTAIRDSVYLFPTIEGTHVLALGISVGLVMWFDLRLVGLMMRHRTVSEVFDGVKSAMFIGFGVMFMTGGILFWSLPLRCYGSAYFWAKMTMLILAGINIAFFHSTIDRRRAEWDKAPVPPLRARLAGVVSLFLWIAIIFVGRTMAYFLQGVTRVWNEAWESFRPFFLWCNETWIGEAVRGSKWAFAIVEVFHLWGLTILVGSLAVLYMRLTGLAMRRQPVAQVARQFAPWTVVGLSVMAVSGGALFLSEAVKCLESDPFRIKMAFLLPAVLFHFTLYRKLRWLEDRPSPIWHKFSAVVAASLWLGVGIAGRWIGFY